MPLGRVRAAGPLTHKTRGSSRRSPLQRSAEESRHFGASPAPLTVNGSLKGWSLPRAGLRRLLQAYLAALALPQAGVNLEVLDDAASQALNRRFRGVDAPTD